MSVIHRTGNPDRRLTGKRNSARWPGQMKQSPHPQKVMLSSEEGCIGVGRVRRLN